MDNTGEIKESQQKPERIIVLGQEFYPFDLSHINSRINKDRIPGRLTREFYSKIKLEVDDLKIPIWFTTNAKIGSKVWTITPFDPDVGSNITYEDLDLQSRLEKIRRLRKELAKESFDSNRASSELKIATYADELNKNGLNIRQEKPILRWNFPEEMLATLSRLRVKTSFPTMSLGAKISEISLNLGDIDFHPFYPLDTGPLPVRKDIFDAGIMEGFSVFLPDDPEKLSQMRTRFILVEERPEEQ